MVKAGADRFADMLPHGQLSVKQDTEVADNVSQFHGCCADLQGTFRFLSTERGSRAEPGKLHLGGIELEPAQRAPFLQVTNAG